MVKTQFRHKIIIGIVTFAVIVTVFMCVFCYDTSTVSDSGNLDGNYMTVLADIDGIVEADPRYVDIATLGSHDAVTDKIKWNAPLDLNEEGGVLDTIEPISIGVQYRFSKTQTVGLGAQLAQGARFFHIKCTDYYGTWYGSHARLCGKLDSDLNEVLQYLSTDEAKGEIVSLLFQPTYFGEDATLDTLSAYIDSVKYDGKSLFDYIHMYEVDVYDEGNGAKRIGELTYNELTQNGTEPGVVILYRRENGRFLTHWNGNSELTKKCFDMDSCSDHQWHSAIGSDRIIKKINESCDRIASDITAPSKLRINQTQASMSIGRIGDLFELVSAWSLLGFASRHNLRLLNNENLDRWLTYMPIFQVDFCNSSNGNFNQKINERIKAHNQNNVNKIIAQKRSLI